MLGIVHHCNVGFFEDLSGCNPTTYTAVCMAALEVAMPRNQVVNLVSVFTAGYGIVPCSTLTGAALDWSGA